MGKYISMTILIAIGSVVILFLLAMLFEDGTGVIPIGLVLIILLSIIITQLIRIGDILKKRWYKSPFPIGAKRLLKTTSPKEGAMIILIKGITETHPIV